VLIEGVDLIASASAVGQFGLSARSQSDIQAGSALGSLAGRASRSVGSDGGGEAAIKRRIKCYEMSLDVQVCSTLRLAWANLRARERSSSMHCEEERAFIMTSTVRRYLLVQQLELVSSRNAVVMPASESGCQPSTV
jgi:hypothetical protein